MFVDEEHRQQEVLYSDFKRYQNEEYITSAVVNAFFWLLNRKYSKAVFGKSLFFNGWLKTHIWMIS